VPVWAVNVGQRRQGRMLLPLLLLCLDLLL
jgi:hypothetical protein